MVHAMSEIKAEKANVQESREGSLNRNKDWRGSSGDGCVPASG